MIRAAIESHPMLSGAIQETFWQLKAGRQSFAHAAGFVFGAEIAMTVDPNKPTEIADELKFLLYCMWEME